MKKEKRIVIVKKEIGKKFEIGLIENKLEEFQEFVGGYIEVPYICEKLSENGIDVIVNDSGMIDNLPVGLALVHNGVVVGGLFGNVIFVSHDKNGNFIGLNEKQIEILKEATSQGVGIDSEGNEISTFVID